MKKKRIIYSLTSRGLFSEISNLSLAIVYAEHYGEKLIINTENWNSKVNKGWEDYFLPTVPCINSIASYQLKVSTKEKIWFGKIYYDPYAFFHFYKFYFANKLYLFFHPCTELSRDVFFKMRTKKFINENLNGDVLFLMSNVLKRIFIYNKETEMYIVNAKLRMQIPKNYIGVHIRRGDKISEHEMDEVDLMKYIDAILVKSDYSKNVYIATDDVSIIPIIKNKLSGFGFDVFYNTEVTQSGFDQGTFNNKTKSDRYNDTLNTLLDIDLLINSTFFIGTFSSNVSRVIPLFLGIDNCLSLDYDWDILYNGSI